MKVGDLVRPVQPDFHPDLNQETLAMPGIVIGFNGTDVIVFWDEDYPDEWEYPEQLEVISE
jgi:hypothetical protein